MTNTTTDLDRWIDLRAWVEPAGREEATPRLIVEATIPEGGHIEAHEPPEPFLIPTTLEVVAPEGVIAGPVEYPQPAERRLDWSPAVLHVLAGTVRFEAPLHLEPSQWPDSPVVRARLSYQGCIDLVCLPPRAQSVEALLSG